MLHPSPQFHAVDSAILLLGGCPISIYNSSPPARIRTLARHCQARVLVVEDRSLLNSVLEVRDQMPQLRTVVVIDAGESPVPPSVFRWDDIVAAEPVEFERCAEAGRPDDLCTVVYTSGSTGEPKGVMLDHAAALWTCESYLRRMGRDLTGARWISYLPVAHIATRIYAQYLHVYAGLEDVTCPNPADVDTVLVERPPQLFFAPPRIWEQYLSGLESWIETSGDPQRRSEYKSAIEVSRQAALIELDGGSVPPDLAGRRDAARPVCRELRARLGLGDLVTGATGAAPTTPTLIATWIGLGVPMFEGYGLSESTGFLTVDPFAYRFGRVGRPMPGVQMRVAPDGELLFRSGNAFRGYLGDPDLTAQTVDGGGWVHTGDLGRIEDGYVVLEGRKKELIITSGGQNISPTAVEMALQSMPLIGQVCVVGDNRPTLGALIALEPDVALRWLSARGRPVPPRDQVHLDELLHTEVAREIATANLQLPRHERLTHFRLLPGEWSIDSDELTPTGKLRRGAIAAKYEETIDAMFASPATVPGRRSARSGPVAPPNREPV
jgi:long-chain acyl-CoA synthetase